MEGIPSINVSSFNEFCNKMAKTQTICQKCYARRIESYRFYLTQALKRNTEILSNPMTEFPKYDFKVLRFNSFGELINFQHYENIIKICENNPDTVHTLWSKRIDIVSRYIKPKNLILIYSNPFIDTIVEPFPPFNHTFNVMTTGSERINCKSKCKDCFFCYDTTKNGRIIIEKVK